MKTLVDMEIITYWECLCTDHLGVTHNINIEKNNKSACNILTLGYKFQTVFFREHWVRKIDYIKLKFTNYE